MKLFNTYWFACAVLLFLAPMAAGQAATGTPKFGSFTSGLDAINLGDLNVHLDVPVLSKAGRGMPFAYTLSFDSSVWYPSGGTLSSWTPVSNWGWRAVTEAAVGEITYATNITKCFDDPPGWYWGQKYGPWIYHDPSGTVHQSNLIYTNCINDNRPHIGTMNDNSGLTLNADAATIITPDGKKISAPVNTGTGSGSVTDQNGNLLSAGPSSFTDTLGTTVLSISGTAPNPVTMVYTDSNGAQQAVTINYTTVTVQTNFGCGGISEFGPQAANLVSSIVFPDGSSYSFTYEPTPGFGGKVTGRIQSITLPTSGQIAYTYTGGNNGITCTDGSAAGLTRATKPSPPIIEGTWTYGRSGSTTTITDPAGNQTVVQFQDIFEVQRDVYSGTVGTSNLLQTAYTCYNGMAYPCTSGTVSLPISRLTGTTKVGSFYSQIDTTFNSFGLPLVTKEYDFGSGLPGVLLRETNITYTAINGTIQDHATDIIVKDGSGHRVSETQIAYDGAALTATSGATQHDYTNYSSSFTARGNATSVRLWVNGTTFNTTTSTYDDLGNLRTTTDPGGHRTTFDYTDSYSDGVNHNTQAFVSTITRPTTTSGGIPPTAHVTKGKYYWPSAMLYQATDENSQITTYTYNSMWRPLTVNYPDGGNTTFTYWNPNQTDVQRSITSSTNTYSATLLDGYGRISRVASLNGETNPWNQQDFCYDSRGQLSFQSYAYRGSGWATQKVCSNAGDSFAYDAMGRPTSVTHSDGNFVTTTYSGRAVQVQDEGNGSTRVTHVYQLDSLGRTVTACELAGSIFGISTMPTCGLDLAGNSNGVTTSYTYDPLGNVTQISQGALIARQMTYDGLGHLLTEKIPEAGGTTTSFGYNAEGLLGSRTRPSANQATSCIAQSNCATTTTNYNYDELHRLWTVSYIDATSENTPNLAFFYDNPNPVGMGGYNIGRMTSAYVEDKAFSTIYVGSNIVYDIMGRLATDQQNFHNGSAWSTFYVTHTYNLLGLLATSKNGMGVTSTYSYNVAGRVTQMNSDLADANHPGTLFSAAHFNAGGELLSRALGNGVNETLSYDARWRPLSVSATKGATTLYSLGGPGTGGTMTYAPNSQLTAMNDSSNGNWTYSYDALNRIAAANKSGGSNFTFDIDRNANRWHQNPAGQGAQAAFDSSTNHIANIGVVYDAAGNIINDGVYSYTYDAEYRITRVDGGAVSDSLASAFSSNWTVSNGAFANSGAGLAGTSTNTQRAVAFYKGPFSDDQFAELTMSYLPAVSDGLGPALRVQPGSGICGGTYYGFYVSLGPAKAWLFKCFNDTITVLSSLAGQSVNVGDVLRLEVAGTALTAKINGVIVLTANDSDISRGNPGIQTHPNSPTSQAGINFNAGLRATATYFYDALGRRVRRTVSGGDYEDVYDGTNMVAEVRASDGMWMRGEIYAGSHLATYNMGTTFFSHKDWQGSERVRSDVNGNSIGTCTGNTYGDSYACTGTDPSPIRYAGMEYDSDSQLYHTQFRYYNPRLALWMTPDPAGLAVAVPDDPQSLNRYAYAFNDPVNFTDPTGLLPAFLCRVFAGIEEANYWDCIQISLGGFRFPPNDQGCRGRGCVDKPDKPDKAKNEALRKAFCAALPEGRTEGLSGSVGVFGGVQANTEILYNYNTGEVSLFFSAGGFLGYNGGIAGGPTLGLVRNLGDSNTNYSGPFTNAGAGVGPIGLTVSASSKSNGFFGNFTFPKGGAQAATLSFSPSSLLSAPVSGSVSNSFYTQPFTLGNIGAGFDNSTTPLGATLTLYDRMMFTLRSICR